MATPSYSAAVTLQEVLRRLDAGELCGMRVVKYDAQRGRGGDIMDIVECKLLAAEKSPRTYGKQKGAAPSPDEDPDAPTPVDAEAANLPDDRRDPNHFRHFTRNVRLYQDGSPTSIIRKIHPPLIIEFGGAPVI